MKESSAMSKRVKSLVNQIVKKDADCRIEESENGEIVIYTGIVKVGTRYRTARPEEQMDYVSDEELKEFEENGITN